MATPSGEDVRRNLAFLFRVTAAMSLSHERNASLISSVRPFFLAPAAIRSRRWSWSTHCVGWPNT